MGKISISIGSIFDEHSGVEQEVANRVIGISLVSFVSYKVVKQTFNIFMGGNTSLGGLRGPVTGGRVRFVL